MARYRLDRIGRRSAFYAAARIKRNVHATSSRVNSGTPKVGGVANRRQTMTSSVASARALLQR